MLRDENDARIAPFVKEFGTEQSNSARADVCLNKKAHHDSKFSDVVYQTALIQNRAQSKMRR
jgi:hypothetical protein